VTKLGFKPVLIGGLALIAAGLLWFSQVSAGGGYVSDILFPSLLAGGGPGLLVRAGHHRRGRGHERRRVGLASGLINTSQQIGGALGLAILATVANSRTDGLVEAGARPSPSALTEGFQAAFLTGAGFAVLGIIAALTLIKTADSNAMKGAEAVPVAA
jgi:hypothetical protein